MILWSERYSLKCNRSKEWRTTSWTPSSTKRIFNHEAIIADNVDSGNELDSELEEDAPATISIELIVAYLNIIVITPLKMRVNGGP